MLVTKTYIIENPGQRKVYGEALITFVNKIL